MTTSANWIGSKPRFLLPAVLLALPVVGRRETRCLPREATYSAAPYFIRETPDKFPMPGNAETLPNLFSKRPIRKPSRSEIPA
jgi:hypothetical protein